MNCLSQVSSAIFRTTGRSVGTGALYAGIKLINFESALSRFRTQLYSSQSKGSKATSSRPRKKRVMDPEKDPFYVVRKGDVVGVMAPTSSNGETAVKNASKKRSHQESESENVEVIGSTSVSDNPSRKQTKTRAEVEVPPAGRGCTLHFDGASKGNPGVAGAGAVLRADDGSLICKLREGLGVATNNVAEYRAVILGLKYALKKGFTRIFVQGDSKLVYMQVQGLWQVKNQNMSNLYEEVKKLKNKFVSFKISHVLRELNSEADAQANLAITLSDGQVQEESGK